MSAWLDVKYVNLISGQLRNFKRKSNNTYNFSCPFCGDSQKDQRKARGFVYSTKDGWMYHCHNCGKSSTVKTLLKQVNPYLHEEYIKEQLLERYEGRQKTDVEKFADRMKKPEYVKRTGLSELKKISQLNHDHPAKIYITSRKIPNEFHSRLFYAPKFKAWTNGQLPGKFKTLDEDSGRIIIPLIDSKGNFFGYQGRAVDTSDEVRYISIMLDEDHPKVYGMDHVDTNRKTYVFEGPFDSMFIPNSIAVAGGDLFSAVRVVDRMNSVLVFDNEPRSTETTKKIQKAINLGHTVCIWPTDLKQKDVNEMVLDGLDPAYIKKMIDENSAKDMQAQLMFNMWNKSQ